MDEKETHKNDDGQWMGAKHQLIDIFHNTKKRLNQLSWVRNS
jgi:hypothetical protein